MKAKRVTRLILAGIILSVAAAAAVALIPTVRHRNQNVALGRSWANLLKKHPVFSGKRPAYPIRGKFSYALPTDENLKTLRDRYGLEAVAGQGSETERIINLMRWVHRMSEHANEPEIPEEPNALNLIPLAMDGHMAFNCYMKTIVLDEVYLAMGFPSRRTHLLPHSNEEEESHFVASVYARGLRKWVLMDPDFGVYVTDEKGTILGVAEIRRRLIERRKMKVVEVDAPRSVLTRAWSEVQNYVDGTSYLWYLRKNIFKLECPLDNEFNQKARPNRVYIDLIPDGYREELLQAPRITERGNEIDTINDEALFWQEPA